MSLRSRLGPLRANLRWTPYLVIAALLVAPLAGQFLLSRPSPPPGARAIPSELEAVLISAFADDRCTTGANAERDLRERLEHAGLGEWSIDSKGVRPDECVTWTLSQSDSEGPGTIAFMGALSPGVRLAMRNVREESLVRCLTKDEAITLVTSALTALGETGFQVRTDGPFQVPLDREEAVLQHFEAGCWIYSTFGWMDGQNIFFISGKQ